jgi:serine/threonine protein kinase
MVAILKDNIKYVTWDEGQPLGSGQFWIVYKGVRKPCPGTVRKWEAGEVAVSVPRDPISGQQAISRFLNEVETMSRVRHPCCLSLFAWNFNSKGEYALVTDLAVTSLGKVLEEESRGASPAGWNGTAKSCCAFGIAAGMAYLHSKNIIHRNLNPENILLDERLRPKIGGFGSAKLVSVENQMNMTMKVGTPLYMAPELSSGDGGYTGAVDVYAFGMLLFEIATAKRPFSDMKFANRRQFARAVEQGTRPEFLGGEPDECRELIQRCWHHTPTQRPAFSEIIADLRAGLILPDTDETAFEDFVNDILEGRDPA